MTTFFLILISAVILICVWLNNLSSKIGVPTLLAFILLGILFANNGLIPIDFVPLSKDQITQARSTKRITTNITFFQRLLWLNDVGIYWAFNLV